MAETVPPLTAKDIEADLTNPEFAVYLSIGQESDRGWKFARTAFKLIPRLRIYLVLDRTQIAKWDGLSAPVGIVFGWGDKVHAYLTRSQTEDLQLVLDKIEEAMSA